MISHPNQQKNNNKPKNMKESFREISLSKLGKNRTLKINNFKLLFNICTEKSIKLRY